MKTEYFTIYTKSKHQYFNAYAMRTWEHDERFLEFKTNGMKHIFRKYEINGIEQQESEYTKEQIKEKTFSAPENPEKRLRTSET